MTRLVGSFLASVTLLGSNLAQAAVVSRQTRFEPSSVDYTHATSTLVAWQVAGMLNDRSEISNAASSVDSSAPFSTASSLSPSTIKSTLVTISQNSSNPTADYVSSFESLNTEFFIQKLLAALPTFSTLGDMGAWYQCAFMGSSDALAAQKISYNKIWTQVCDKVANRPYPSTGGTFAGDVNALKTARSRLFAAQWQASFPQSETQAVCGSFDKYTPQLISMGLDAAEVNAGICQASTEASAAKVKTLMTQVFELELFGVSSDRLYYNFWCQYTNVERLNTYGIDGQTIKNDACSKEQAALQGST